MWRKKTPNRLTGYSSNELLTELFKRGDLPLFPSCEEDELKIRLFKNFWQRLSPSEIDYALSKMIDH